MIVLNKVNKQYGDKVVLKNLSLNIKRGEFVAIVGRSGCGKSTLLNIIGLLEDSDSGMVAIDGEEDVGVQSARATKLLRTKISYLFQNFALIDEETVYYNLKLALRYVKGNKKILIANALKKVGLEGFEQKKIYQLSGGEQQRIAVARILLKPAEIILADEPTGSLDEYNRELIVEMLEILHREGKTVVVVTHDNNVAMRCERIIHLD